MELPVTLTCSSDANPPVHTYTWYHGSVCSSTAETSFHQGREFLSTPTGTGQTLSIDIYGPHCCIASNKHGSQMYTVTLSDSSGRCTICNTILEERKPGYEFVYSEYMHRENMTKLLRLKFLARLVKCKD